MAMRDIPYSSELEAQEDFYRYMAEVGLFPQEEVDFSGHTDGVFGNILLENKLEIRGNYFKALRQMIKYQAKRMWRGKTLPRYMIANGLNDRWSYVFLTEDFISEIEEIPVSAESASKGNSSYHTDIQPIAQFNWYTLDGLSELKKYKEDPTLGPRYHVSVNNIIGLSKQAYKNGLTKTQFLDEEIRHPNLLADRILPYEESTNDAFKKVMDVLNTPVMQRELGAFYTPVVYVQKAQEFLMKAIDEIKAMGKDYVIIDRCAGTGNLEEGLSDEILAHCILNTLEYEEALCLAADYADKVLSLSQEDALSMDILEDARPYVEDPNCVVILFENPPYSEVGSGRLNGVTKTNSWKNSYICNAAKVHLTGRLTNDLANLFVWSAFKYYLTKPEDSYIVFDPVKYWKSQYIVQKTFKEGFICNRKGFHASPAGICCIWWGNEDDTISESFDFNVYELDGSLAEQSQITLKKVHDNLTSINNDKSTYEGDYSSVACAANGNERTTQKLALAPIMNDEPGTRILGYMDNSSFTIDAQKFHITRLAYYDGHGNYIRENNLLNLAPSFCAGAFPKDEWWEKETYQKSADFYSEALKDTDFCRKALLYMGLAPTQKCKSIMASTGRAYRNELCFDGDTFISQKYDELCSCPDINLESLSKEQLLEYVKTGIPTNQSQAEKNLLNEWYGLLNSVKTNEEYGAPEYRKLVEEFGDGFTLGFWQIIDDININAPEKTKSGTAKKQYESLNTRIKNFKEKLKQFYEDEILPGLFQYELVK